MSPVSGHARWWAAGLVAAVMVGCGSTWELEDRDGDGFSWLYGDCDDDDARINPAAEEICDGVDNDCDGLSDPPSATGTREWYGDKDGDGFAGAEVLVSACEQPDGYALDWDDCDDSNGGVNPDTLEYCDDIDNNCDGVVDEPSALDARMWYPDIDGDGFGDEDLSLGVRACDAPTGHVEDSTDCDDSDESINPDAEDVPNDGIDHNCDGEDN